jgi:hypothetical protein
MIASPPCNQNAYDLHDATLCIPPSHFLLSSAQALSLTLIGGAAGQLAVLARWQCPLAAASQQFHRCALFRTSPKRGDVTAWPRCAPVFSFPVRAWGSLHSLIVLDSKEMI